MNRNPHRRGIRLKGYDYSNPGACFITIVTQGRACLFGDVMDGEMRVNEAAQMVGKWCAELNHKFPNMQTDELVTMPNHFHGIVATTSNPVGAALCVCPIPDGQGKSGAPDQDAYAGTGAHTEMGIHTGAPRREELVHKSGGNL